MVDNLLRSLLVDFRALLVDDLLRRKMDDLRSLLVDHLLLRRGIVVDLLHMYLLVAGIWRWMHNQRKGKASCKWLRLNQRDCWNDGDVIILARKPMT